MRIAPVIAMVAGLSGVLCATQAFAQQARKWVEPDGRVIYSDLQPSKTAKLAGAVKADSQSGSASEKIEAGKVELIEGQVSVTGADSKPRNVLTGSILLEGDSVSTGEKGELHAEMADGAVIAVRPNSQIRIVRYRAKGNSADTSVMSLLKGSFRSVTGWIVKTNPQNYKVQTPIATIGARGTDHETLYIPAGSKEGTPGVYDKVNIGSTVIEANTGGSVTVPAGQAGFAGSGAQARPQVLPSVPSVFRTPANDSKMQGRHDRVQTGLTDKRSQAQQGQGMQKGGGPGAGQGAGQGGGKGGGQGAGQGGQGGQSGQGGRSQGSSKGGAGGTGGSGGSSGQSGPGAAQGGSGGQQGTVGQGGGQGAGGGAPRGGQGASPGGGGGGSGGGATGGGPGGPGGGGGGGGGGGKR